MERGAVYCAYLTDVTSQLRATAARQIREPRKPLPPKTTILFVVDMAGLFYDDACMLRSSSDACEFELVRCKSMILIRKFSM